VSGPTVGVVMPARDAERYIGAAIESVLTQGVAGIELVLVDDGSTDRTAAIGESFGQPVTVLRCEPRGPAAARNAGLRHLVTDFIGFLDADDLWPLGSLAVRLEALAADPEADLCFGHMIQFISPDLPADEQRRLRVDPRPQPAWASSAMLARRSAFERVGLLPEHRRAGDFLEWLVGARNAGLRSLMLEQVVLHRRLHLNNLTRREPEANAHYLAVVRAELARRRAAGK
jgi:glycosyltransferase involved in cell wall biosynthesis